MLVSNHLRQYLPTLIALAANSPYWPQRDTGYASWRTIAWTRWPVAGPPPYFTSAAHYDSVIATLTEVGGLVDAGTVFWDLRPSARFPTLVDGLGNPVDPGIAANLHGNPLGFPCRTGRRSQINE